MIIIIFTIFIDIFIMDIYGYITNIILRSRIKVYHLKMTIIINCN